jgi:UDPglucose--hexose-1-phosphate uridylyltransferase
MEKPSANPDVLSSFFDGSHSRVSLRSLPMPELRKDPIVGRWVIIATDRAKRPIGPKNEPHPPETGVCPFCEGQEEKTPHEILSYRDRNSRPNERGWRVRVVPNKYPALQVEGDLHKRGEGIYDKMNGIGAHEVIVECPFHESTMTNLSEDNIREVLWVYRDRLVDLKKDPRLVYGMLFKNVGVLAGASIEHTHSQLIVTPIVPISVWEEMSGSLELRQLRPVRQPLSLRDVDPAQAPQQPFREYPKD